MLIQGSNNVCFYHAANEDSWNEGKRAQVFKPLYISLILNDPNNIEGFYITEVCLFCGNS